MRLNRFIGKYDLSQKEVQITDIQTIKQIKTVLRLEIGDLILLSDGKGTEAEVAITTISKESISGTILKTEKKDERQKEVSLYLAILKKENFELAVQKAVECGVSNIIPVIVERTIKTGLNIPRLEKIILEASEQCGQNIVPILHPIMDFEKALAHGKTSEEKLIFHFTEKEYGPKKNIKSASIFVGPEGGFTEKEIELAKESGYSVASLGSLVLRGETAAIIGTYRAVHEV